MKVLSEIEQQLFDLLDKKRNPAFYSYSVESICSKLNIDLNMLKTIGENIRNKLDDNYKVNIFEWTAPNSKTRYQFAGFEYRRHDYERDKLLNNNIVEKLIQSKMY